MSPANSIRITPSVLSWARDRLDKPIEQICMSMDIDPGDWENWVNAKASPTFNQARDLARILRIPFGFLFLSHPPVDSTPLPDLRTVTGQPPPRPSVDMIDAINDVLRKQHWYREFLENKGQKPLEFVGRFTLQNTAENVANNIRETLGIDTALRNQSPSWSAFQRTIIERCEGIGVLIMRSGTVAGNPYRPLNVDEFRGFVLSDALAPVIFLNSKDALVAQIFTLAHELAHIWIGESGISNPDFNKKSAEQSNNIERYCNRVAAEVLVPAADFSVNWKPTLPLEVNIQRLARFYRVSAAVITIQAYNVGAIDRKQHHELMSKEYDAKKVKKESGGSYYNNLFARNSHKFIATVTGALRERSVLFIEAAGLLGVRVPILQKLELVL